jgi:hypothetical protein
VTLTQRLTTYWWMIAGLVILIPPCLAQAWEPCVSTINPYGRAPRPIDRWKSLWLQSIYGNEEDSVSGKEALIWNSTGTARVLYMPDSDKPSWLSQYLWDSLRAYCWNQRNSTNALTRRYGKT